MTTSRFLNLLLLGILLGSLGLGKYYPRLYITDLSILLLLATLGLLVLKVKLTRQEWRRTLLRPAIYIAAAAFFYSFIFSSNTQLSQLSSLVAGRWLVLWLVAPVVYYCYKSGVEIADLEKTLYLTMVLLSINYILAYNFVDFKAMASSTDDPAVAAMVTGTAEEWRGIRLKGPPGPIWPMMLMASFLKLRNREQGRVMNICIFLLALGLMTLSMDRFFTASTLIAIVTYWLLTKINKRSMLLAWSAGMAALVLAALILPAALEFLDTAFSSDVSYTVRLDDLRIALKVIGEHPLFGYGIASNYTKSYSDLFGKNFYTADIGIFGVCMTYGFVGTLIYFFLNYLVLKKAFRCDRNFFAVFRRTSPVSCALFIALIAMTYSVSIEAWLSSPGGIVLAAFALGLALCHEDRWRRESIFEESHEM